MLFVFREAFVASGFRSLIAWHVSHVQAIPSAGPLKSFGGHFRSERKGRWLLILDDNAEFNVLCGYLPSCNEPQHNRFALGDNVP